MIKAVSDISGDTPAVPVQIMAGGTAVLSLDMTQVEVANLVAEIMGKMQVADVAAVMKVAAPVVAAAAPVVAG